MDIYDVVKKLVGNINPIGSSYEDEKRLKNIEEHINLTEALVCDLKEAAAYKNHAEYSMRAIAIKADTFLNNLNENT